MKTTTTLEKPTSPSSQSTPKYILRLRRGNLWEDNGEYKTPGAAMQGYFALGRHVDDSIIVINSLTRGIVVAATVLNKGE